MLGVWKNRKHGNNYAVIARARSGTNATHGQERVIYMHHSENVDFTQRIIARMLIQILIMVGGDLYVRDAIEFTEKFDPVEGGEFDPGSY